MEFEDVDLDFVPKCEQITEELDWMIDRLVANNVSSLLALGVAHGGVEYQVAKRYASLGRPITITGVDITFVEDLWDTHKVVSKLFPNVVINYIRHDLRWPMKNFMLGQYDFVFVDADHSYESITNDFKVACRQAKNLVGFHDIKGTDVEQFWAELKGQRQQHTEKITSAWMGIGIVSLDDSYEIR